MRHPGGRPRVKVDPEEVKRLRAKGMSWRRIGQTLGIGASTALALFRDAELRPGAEAGGRGVQKLLRDDLMRD